MEQALKWLQNRDRVDNLALFLDFDGTLAPIVERPGDARALEGIPGLVERIGRRIPVAVISGRDAEDVAHRLGVEGIYYAGSHGMDLLDPQGQREASPQLERLLEVFDDCEQQLQQRFSEAPRVEIERKRYGVALHFRRRPEAREIVEKALERIVDQTDKLKMGIGKKVRELQPDVDIDKGTALRRIRGRIDDEYRRMPVYIGDDTTDEDAFEAVREDGWGILVAEEPRDTAARLIVDSPEQVRALLASLAERLDETDRAHTGDDSQR